MPRVLISDKMSARAEEIFKQNNIDVDVITGQTPDELKSIIGQYDGLAIRSSTTVTADILESAPNLKIIARAGIGTDNIDKDAATKHGVIVMNTPFGNMITTAEHTIAMIMASARNIPQANQGTHNGEWPKSKYMGVELFNKTLGVIGCGNIGGIVINRAQGLKMKVIGFDPFLTDERAIELGIEKVGLDDLYARSDFITLHVPKTDQTTNMINTTAIEKMKHGVRIINVARGGLINEADLLDGLKSGKIAGAALDVFAVEPAKDNPLFGRNDVICTPHLGASTDEAQENVAIQVAEQISDFLNNGAVTNALNMPSISAEDAPKLKPYLKLSEQMGLMMGQITDSAIQSINIEYSGAVSKLNNAPLTSVIIASVLKSTMDDVNMVSAPTLAKNRGIAISTTFSESAKNYDTAIRLIVKTDNREKEMTGLFFADKKPRIVSIDHFTMDATITPFMIFIRNEDKPGLIGDVGKTLGDAGVNIADFTLGQIKTGSEAVALISVDSEASKEVITTLQSLPLIKQAKALKL